MAEALIVLYVVVLLLALCSVVVEGWRVIRQWAVNRAEHWLLEGNQLPTLAGYLLVRWRQWRCGVSGHREELNTSFDRMWLVCWRCGHETEGFKLQEPSSKRVA